MNVSYNEKILDAYSVDDPIQTQLNSVAASNMVMSNDNVRVSDKEIGNYGAVFNPCIKYLSRMRKYSKRNFVKGVGGFYSLNPRYLSNISEPYDMELLKV